MPKFRKILGKTEPISTDATEPFILNESQNTDFAFWFDNINLSEKSFKMLLERIFPIIHNKTYIDSLDYTSPVLFEPLLAARQIIMLVERFFSTADYTLEFVENAHVGRDPNKIMALKNNLELYLQNPTGKRLKDYLVEFPLSE